MATIEELREQENQPRNTFILGGGPAVMTVFNPSEDDSPDTVLFRLTNCRSVDVLWLTADGQLHFGAQALAGLTKHVLGEWLESLERFCPVCHHMLTSKAHHQLCSKEFLAELWEAQADQVTAQQTGLASWNCRRCGGETGGYYETERERCMSKLCKVCWLELEEDKGIYRTEIPDEQLQGKGLRLVGDPPAPELYGLCPVCGQAADHLHPLMDAKKPEPSAWQPKPGILRSALEETKEQIQEILASGIEGKGKIVSSEKLAALAEKHKPPNGWYEETDTGQPAPVLTYEEISAAVVDRRRALIAQIQQGMQAACEHTNRNATGMLCLDCGKIWI
jgi:hypothetical protein